MSRRLRVLCVSHLGSRGGAQKCLRMLCEAVDRERFDLAVVVPVEGELASDLRAIGIDVIAAPLQWWVGIKGREDAMAASFRRGLSGRVDVLAELISRGGFDLVLTNSSVVVEGALAAARAGVPHVWHVLEMMSRDPSLRPMYPLSLFYWLLDRLSADVAVVSDSVREEMRSLWSGAHPVVIHTGIESLERSGLRASKPETFGCENRDPVVCFVGELSERKGVRFLIEAIPLILRSQPQARFAIVGPNRGELDVAQRMTRQLGIAERVRFLGQRSDALRVLASADVFVLPSLSDPFPVVLLEAMALATPVVATRSGGAAEMVNDGESGLLCEPGSAPELAEAVAKLLADPERADGLGRAAQRRARERYSQRGNAEAFEALFMSCQRAADTQVQSEARMIAELIAGTRTVPSEAPRQAVHPGGLGSLVGRLVRKSRRE